MLPRSGPVMSGASWWGCAVLSSPRGRSAPRLQALEGRQPGPWGCGRLAPPWWRRVGCMMGGWRPQAPEQVPHRVQAPQEGGEDGDVGTRDVLGVVQVRQRGQAFLSPLPIHGQLSKYRVLEPGHSLWPSRRDQDVGPPPTRPTPRPQGWREGQTRPPRSCEGAVGNTREKGI